MSNASRNQTSDLPIWRRPSEQVDKRGIPWSPESAVGVPVILGETDDGRVVMAIPSWERISVSPVYDKEKLDRLVDAATDGRTVEVRVRTGKPVGDDGWRPRFVATVEFVEDAS